MTWFWDPALNKVLPRYLEGKSREYSKQKDIMVPNEILINKKLNNPAIFQKWEEFFFESGLWSYYRWFNSSLKYEFLFDQQIILSTVGLLILAYKDPVLTYVFLTGSVWFMFEAAQGVCTLSDYIAEHGALSETQAR